MGPRPGKPRVLVVDDDALVLGALARALAATFVVLTAPSAAQALQVLIDNTVDVLVTDLDMPGGPDGIALLAVARAAYPRVRRVLLSAKPEPCTDAELTFAKPWPRDFARRLLALLTSRR